MGVHDKDRYGEIKEALGIPEDEPIFIIRAKDRLGPAMVDLYEVLYSSAIVAEYVGGSKPSEQQNTFMDEIGEVYDEFRRYQHEHPELVKTPD